MRLRICLGLAAVWFVAFIASAAMADGAARAAAGGVQGLALLVFVLLHGSLSNGWKGFAAFAGVSLAVSFALEASSIAGGFPFGFYVHNISGPKPLGVPLTVPVGYLALGWLAWCVARVIVRERPGDAGGLNRFTTPVVASLILAGYDFAYDPIGGTVLGMWTYRSPSGQFGVPLSNFFGWILTGWVFFQLFALVERRFPARRTVADRRLWLAPCLIWLGSALQYPILLAHAPAGVVSRGGRTFVIADVYEACLIASLFTVVFVALLAIFRLYGRARTT